VDDLGTSMHLNITATGRAVARQRRHEQQQKDELCAAFCVAVVVNALTDLRISQDDAALAAGSILGEVPDPANLPPGSGARRDYLRPVPTTSDARIVGTSASGAARAVAETSAGKLRAIPLAGPWSSASAGKLLDLAARPDAAVIVNLHTRYLWNTHVDVVTAVDFLEGRDVSIPPCEWQVGHFVLLLGSLGNDRNRLALCGDTYPALGSGGVHFQPLAALADALKRPDERSAGGALVVTFADQAGDVRRACESSGLRTELWDNGTPDAGAPSL
jgi:hypothetical protein